MESRSGSIKDPIYYPENDGTSSCGGGGGGGGSESADKSQRSSLNSQEISLEDGNALKVPRKFITNWRQACDRTRDRTKDLLKRWRTTSSNIDELAVAPAVVAELEQPSWSVHVWSEYIQVISLALAKLLLRSLFGLLCKESALICLCVQNYICG